MSAFLNFDPLDSIPPAFQNFNPSDAEKEIVKFIRKSVKKSGASGVVLGLSGGIDSALVAALSAKALGTKKVYPIFFLGSDSECDAEFDSEDLNDAVKLAEQFGLSLQKIDLSSVFSAAKSSFSIPRLEYSASSLFWEFGETPITSGNLKSRLRMALLYYYANRNNLLVIGTKNKTERFTGYFTKYGDGGVDIDPIANLYKTEVRLLSKHLNLPDSIQKKPPSAGFWRGQSDEDDLGIRYDQLDALLLFFETEHVSIRSKKLKKLSRELHLSEKQCESVFIRMIAAQHKQKMPAMPE